MSVSLTLNAAVQDEKNQIMATNVWLEQVRYIYSLRKKDLQTSVYNFNKFKLIFAILAHYPDDTYVLLKT